MFNQIKKSGKFTPEWAVLDEWGLFPEDQKALGNHFAFPFGRIVELCLDKYYEKLSDPRLEDDSRIVVDESFVNPVIARVLDLCQAREIEVNYYYFIYGLNLQGTSDTFDLTRQSYFIFATDAKRQEIALRMNVNAANAYGATFSDMYFVLHCSGWVMGQYRLAYDDINNMKDLGKILGKINLPPAEFYEEAFYLLGFPQTRVRFLSRSSDYSERHVSIDIHPGMVSMSGSHYSLSSKPDWMLKEQLQRPPNAPPVDLKEGDISFIRKYGTFRLQMPSESFHSILFTRFARIVQFKSLWDKIIEAVITLETLLLEESDRKNKTLQYRIPEIFELEPLITGKFKPIIKQLYDMRSEIVHAGGTALNEKVKAFPLPPVEEFAFLLVRCALLRFLQDDGTNLTFPLKSQLTANFQTPLTGLSFRFPACIQYQMAIEALKQKLQ